MPSSRIDGWGGQPGLEKKVSNLRGGSKEHTEMRSLGTSAKSLTLAIFFLTSFARLTVAQNSLQPPCKPLSQDRTITWCYPIDNATFGAFGVLEWGWIKDSLPHTAKEYFDGQFYNNPPDIFNGVTGQGFDDKIHTFTIVVTDAKGTFQKSVSFRQSAQLPCASPLSDRSLNFCIPLEGTVTTSPLRVAAVGRSSVGVSWLQVWVDGVKYFTEHDAGTPNQKLMNNYVYLPNGKHVVTMIAKEADGTSIKKTANIVIVPPPTP
jgi:hypothetical protein